MEKVERVARALAMRYRGTDCTWPCYEKTAQIVIRAMDEVDTYGGRQIAAVHNEMVETCARLQSELAEVYAMLPDSHYMDPPDGGDVTPLEQMKRMAEDARHWREHCGHINHPLSWIVI